MSEAMHKQIAACRALIQAGADIHQLRDEGYAERCIQIAYGRDADSVDPLKGAGPA